MVKCAEKFDIAPTISTILCTVRVVIHLGGSTVVFLAIKLHSLLSGLGIYLLRAIRSEFEFLPMPN